MVRSVDSGSFAEDIGLFEKDVILSINRKPVTQRGGRAEDPELAEARRRGGVPHHASHPGRPRSHAAMDQLLCSRHVADAVNRRTVYFQFR